MQSRQSKKNNKKQSQSVHQNAPSSSWGCYVTGAALCYSRVSAEQNCFAADLCSSSVPLIERRYYLTLDRTPGSWGKCTGMQTLHRKHTEERKRTQTERQKRMPERLSDKDTQMSLCHLWFQLSGWIPHVLCHLCFKRCVHCMYVVCGTSHSDRKGIGSKDLVKE